MAGLLAFQPARQGNRVGIVTDSDALGMLALESSLAMGLDPVGLVRIVESSASNDDRERAVAEVIGDPAVDVGCDARSARHWQRRDTCREPREASKGMPQSQCSQ